MSNDALEVARRVKAEEKRDASLTEDERRIIATLGLTPEKYLEHRRAYRAMTRGEGG